MVGRDLLFGTIVLVVTLGIAVAALELALRAGLVANERHTRLAPDGGDGNVQHRLLVLGDSFMANKPSDDLHDHLLTALGRDRVQMVNTARPGDGPREYLDALNMASSSFPPDVILLCSYVGNDLTDVGCGEGSVFADERPLPQRLAARTYLYDFVRRRWGFWRAATMDFSDLAAEGVDPTLIAAAEDLEINPWVLNMRRYNPEFLRQTLLVEDDCARWAWQRTEELLGAIAARARELDATLLAVTFPHTLQVNDSKHPFYDGLAFAWDDRITTARAPQKRLDAWHAAHDVPHLDLLPVFLAHDGEELYLDRDEHLNWHGETLAAKHMARFVAPHLD